MTEKIGWTGGWIKNLDIASQKNSEFGATDGIYFSDIANNF